MSEATCGSRRFPDVAALIRATLAQAKILVPNHLSTGSALLAATLQPPASVRTPDRAWPLRQCPHAAEPAAQHPAFAHHRATLSATSFRRRTEARRQLRRRICLRGGV